MAKKERCGATTRTGEACKAPVVKGGHRCRRHGGAGHPENQHAKSHGLYGRFLTDEEKERHADVKAQLGTLDEEISLTRHLIARAIAAWHEAHDRDPDGLEVVKRHDREATEYGPGDEVVKERIDYGAHYDRLAKRLESLTKTRSELLKADRENDQGGDDGPVTEFEVHVVTAENVHLYREGGEDDEEK